MTQNIYDNEAFFAAYSRLQRSIELTSRLFEPALMIIIGLVIGAIVVLMYLPIFDLASSIQ